MNTAGLHGFLQKRLKIRFKVISAFLYYNAFEGDTNWVLVAHFCVGSAKKIYVVINTLSLLVGTLKEDDERDVVSVCQ